MGIKKKITNVHKGKICLASDNQLLKLIILALVQQVYNYTTRDHLFITATIILTEKSRKARLLEVGLQNAVQQIWVSFGAMVGQDHITLKTRG